MSIMRRDVLRIRGYAIEKPSDYPSLRNSLTHKITTRVDEDDELFIGYGLMPNPMPFTMQDNYALEESELEFPSIVLENEFLEAVFLPTLGGRLWSLYDKKAKRDLVTRNPVFKPGNFAIRNAWGARCENLKSAVCGTPRASGRHPGSAPLRVLPRPCGDLSDGILSAGRGKIPLRADAHRQSE